VLTVRPHPGKVKGLAGNPKVLQRILDFVPNFEVAIPSSGASRPQVFPKWIHAVTAPAAAVDGPACLVRAIPAASKAADWVNHRPATVVEPPRRPVP
jgi:hypothetical protein